MVPTVYMDNGLILLIAMSLDHVTPCNLEMPYFSLREIMPDWCNTI